LQPVPDAAVPELHVQSYASPEPVEQLAWFWLTLEPQ
jgi:hypothetical protein